MGVSEVLLCPYRCLEYKMERLEKLKIQLCMICIHRQDKNLTDENVIFSNEDDLNSE